MSLRTAEIQGQLLKGEEDEELEDKYLPKEKYPEYWTLLADKGYQGADEFLPCDTPYKKTNRGVLSK